MSSQGKNKIEECPICSFPLDEDGYCSHCKKIPEYPPATIHFEYKGPFLGSWRTIGDNELPDYKIRVIKRYEFDDEWKSKLFSTEEVGDLIREHVKKAILNRHGQEISFEDYELLLKQQNDNLQSYNELIKEYKFLMETLMDFVWLSNEITKVEVKPTKWDEYHEEEINKMAALRIGEGIYFGMKDALILSLSAAMGLFALGSGNVSFAACFVAIGGIEALEKLSKIYQPLHGDQKKVFEAIYGYTIALAQKDFSSKVPKFGEQGPPTITELQAMLQGQLSLSEIEKTLDELRYDRKIVTKDDLGRWRILI